MFRTCRSIPALSLSSTKLSSAAPAVALRSAASPLASTYSSVMARSLHQAKNRARASLS